MSIESDLIQALEQLSEPGDALEALERVTAALLSGATGEDGLAEAWDILIRLFEGNAAWRAALRAQIVALFSTRNTASFFARAGLLPNSGFFSELRRKLAHKLLPEVLDRREMMDCVHLLFPAGQRGMDTVTLEQRQRFWQTLELEPLPKEHLATMLHPMLDAILRLSHRIAAMGLEPELARIRPRLLEGHSAFVALNREALQYVSAFERSLAENRPMVEDEKHLLVFLAQCREEVGKARQAALTRGTSMSLSYLLFRLDQHLTRLERLMAVLAAYHDASARQTLVERWTALMMHALDGERQRNSLRRHFSDLAGHMALRVTENAAHTGEHYIARDHKEWRGIWRAAAGAGVLIACLALFKLLGAGLHLALLNQALLNGAIYGLGFALVYVLHFVIATKQPAMTAATLAGAIDQASGRMHDIQRLTDLVVATLRSQFAAIMGNVMAAFPLAMGIALLAGATDTVLISQEKAEHLLHEIDPFGSAALIYAGIAGIWLCVAGLVSGYFDNLAAYSNIGPRIAQHPLLTRGFGRAWSSRAGAYVEANLGGLAGNLFFGLMLGLTPAIGLGFGLPLDIRHVAFSSANLGYALVALDFQVGFWAFFLSGLGVAAIGMVNLMVSFSLALWIAMRSRGVDFGSSAKLLPELGRRFRASPSRFFVPEKE